MWPVVQKNQLIYATDEILANSITIAVIVPAYNASKTIANTVVSILEALTDQDHIFIVENGSVDETWSILIGLYASNESVTLIQSLEANASNARNLGIEAACAYDYIAFCDADDIWLKNKIQITKELIRKESPDILFHPMLSLGSDRLTIEGGEFINKRLPKSKRLSWDLARYGNFFPTSAMVIKRCKMLDQTFLPSLKHTQDYEAWCALANKLPEIKVVYVERILGIHYWMGGLSQSVISRMKNIKVISDTYLMEAPLLFRFFAKLRVAAHITWCLFKTHNLFLFKQVFSHKINISNLRKK
jgi:glycosyltransferase involved in cell wall biosynthesis